MKYDVQITFKSGYTITIEGLDEKEYKKLTESFKVKNQNTQCIFESKSEDGKQKIFIDIREVLFIRFIVHTEE